MGGSVCVACVACVDCLVNATSKLAFLMTTDRVLARGLAWERISTAILALFLVIERSSLPSDSLGRFFRPMLDSWRVRGELLFGRVALLEDRVLRDSVLLEDLVEIDAIDSDEIVAHGLVIELMAFLADLMRMCFLPRCLGLV